MCPRIGPFNLCLSIPIPLRPPALPSRPGPNPCDAQHMMIDLGTGNNNKINWPMEEPQEFIDIVEVRKTALLAPCPLSPDVAVH